METEVLALIVLYAVAVSALITAINSHGPVRMVMSYLLAVILLITAVFCTFKLQSNREIARKEQERQRYEDQLRKAEEEARLAAMQKPDTVKAPSPVAGDLNKIQEEGAAIARAILAVDVDDEGIDYDKLVGRASGYKGQAANLKKQLDALPKSDDPDIASARDLVEKGVRAVSVAANYFALYFKAENENEEDERWEVYQNNAKSAKSQFGNAAAKLAPKIGAPK